MTERLCTYDENDLDARGKPTPEYLKLYEEWGKGEIGVIVLVRVNGDARMHENSHTLPRRATSLSTEKDSRPRRTLLSTRPA